MLGGGNEGSKEEEKFGDRKVYTRRPFKGLENSRSSSNLLREQQQQQTKVQALVTEGLNSSKRLHNSGFDVGSDNFSGLSRENKVRISLSMRSKREALELKRRLENERDMVRILMRKIEANDGGKNRLGFDDREGDRVNMGVGPPRMSKPLNKLTVSVTDNTKTGFDSMEKEKRTPKANKFYRNSDFLLAKDKIPPSESNNKKSKSKGEKFPNQVLKSCNAVLERLMKHKHSWVFNKPVDPVALGLHDYFEIIKSPMDLGTVKDRLNQNWYKSPMEFAEDVRLTFRNAMTYNPKGQDVYVMAEQLAKLFEEKWAPIVADFDVGPPMKTPPYSRARPEMKKKAMDRSETMAYPVDTKRKTANIAQSGKVSKKPKAKDPVKREMTYDEKQKLSINLQSLPSEKLENVVQIIKKRNPSVSQQDDEIEVDIDSVDTETLWELDRFITNYKKSLSKNKRKDEIVGQLITGLEENAKEKISTPVVMETPKETRAEEEKVASPQVEVQEAENNDTNQGGSQTSSSSDSGSSSSDSDGDSSSVDGSDGGKSPKN